MEDSTHKFILLNSIGISFCYWERYRYPWWYQVFTFSVGMLVGYGTALLLIKKLRLTERFPVLNQGPQDLFRWLKRKIWP